MSDDVVLKCTRLLIERRWFKDYFCFLYETKKGIKRADRSILAGTTI